MSEAFPEEMAAVEEKPQVEAEEGLMPLELAEKGELIFDSNILGDVGENFLEYMFDKKDYGQLDVLKIEDAIGMVEEHEQFLKSPNTRTILEVWLENSRFLDRVSDNIIYLNEHQRNAVRIGKKKRNANSNEREALGKLGEKLNLVLKKERRKAMRQTRVYKVLAEMFIMLEDVLELKDHTKKKRRIAQYEYKNFRNECPDLRTDEKLLAAAVSKSLGGTSPILLSYDKDIIRLTRLLKYIRSKDVGTGVLNEVLENYPVRLYWGKGKVKMVRDSSDPKLRGYERFRIRNVPKRESDYFRDAVRNYLKRIEVPPNL